MTPATLLRCSSCRRELPPERFHRYRRAQRRGERAYRCIFCCAARRPRRSGQRRDSATVRPGLYRCAVCRRAFPVDVFTSWQTASGKRKRGSYCPDCRTDYDRVAGRARRRGPAWIVERDARRRKQRVERRHERLQRTRLVCAFVRGTLADGWTITALAAALGCCATSVQRWRDGRTGRGVTPTTEARVTALAHKIATGAVGR